MNELRAVGAFIGLAIGDAMGAPLEGLPPRPFAVTEMMGGGIHNTSPGRYTDDTLQASALAQTLVRRGGFAPTTSPDAWRAHTRRPGFLGPTSRAVLT
jgi:ADP-ribosyl-[dinitrogen reductase] hydrolase